VTPSPAVIPTSESSWIVVTAAHDRLIGFICAVGDLGDSGYSAHDEDEQPLGTYPTFAGALSALPARVQPVS
jgi:hypothetical protein